MAAIRRRLVSVSAHSAMAPAQRLRSWEGRTRKESSKEASVWAWSGIPTRPAARPAGESLAQRGEGGSPESAESPSCTGGRPVHALGEVRVLTEAGAQTIVQEAPEVGVRWVGDGCLLYTSDAADE